MFKKERRARRFLSNVDPTLSVWGQMKRKRNVDSLEWDVPCLTKLKTLPLAC